MSERKSFYSIKKAAGVPPCCRNCLSQSKGDENPKTSLFTGFRRSVSRQSYGSKICVPYDCAYHSSLTKRLFAPQK